MSLSAYLQEEWKPALGCTEPASIALAAASAAQLCTGRVESVHLICDPRIYKNCYAVGIPNSEHRVGILWALAIGCQLPDPSAKLECFRQVDTFVLEKAQNLIDAEAIQVEVDASKQALFIDCRVQTNSHVGRAVIAFEHTNLVLLEEHCQTVWQETVSDNSSNDVRSRCAQMSFDELVGLATSCSDADQLRLWEGVQRNLAISKHGLSLFPKRFVDMGHKDSLTRISRLVCAGVYARMWGEDFAVMSLAGSGNKGIVCAVPLALYGQELGCDQKILTQALALACLTTSATTHHLGTLSAVCGCSNAAGIGLAAGLVFLEGGGSEQISTAVNNMVGNVTGMICDGAKIGCALKTMTTVDAAFRSSSLALGGIGIPVTDGIVGVDGLSSLANLGRIAKNGMSATDAEILAIMQEKLYS